MTANQNVDYRKQIDELTTYFSNAKGDPSLLKKMREDPIAVLQSMGIPVEEQFKEAVALQVEAHANSMLFQEKGEIAEAKVELMSAPLVPPSPPGGLVVERSPPPDAPVPPEVLNALEFQVKPWGLALAVREPAIKYLQGGGVISAGALGISAALTGLVGPAGVAIGIILGVVAGALAIYDGVITMTDQGQGVYISWTWLSIVMFPHPLSLTPIILPIV